MTVSFRQHYIPKEFPQITVICVYVPGPDFDLAVEHRTVNQAGEPESVSSGGFTHTSVQSGAMSVSSHQNAENTGLVLWQHP